MNQLTFVNAEVRAAARKMPKGQFHCIVTSPPYWALRDYGIAPTLWGGRPRCKHEFDKATYTLHHDRGDSSTLEGASQDTKPVRVTSSTCHKCGAWLGCLGLEPTVQLYIAHLTEALMAAASLLRDDGVMFVNIGDCYAGNGGGAQGKSGARGRGLPPGASKHQAFSNRRDSSRPRVAAKGRVMAKRGEGLKPKDLVGIPWEMAFALRAAGLWLRIDNIWDKTNGLPNSADDRPTLSHETVFLFTKSAHYYYDRYGFQEAVTGNAHPRGDGINPKAIDAPEGVKANERWATSANALVASRNMRSVWTFPTAQFKGAHFATFPPELAERCIRVGTSMHGCCGLCGAAYARAIEKVENLERRQEYGGDEKGEYVGRSEKDYSENGVQTPGDVKRNILASTWDVRTIGWYPTCDCPPADVVPCRVLDPFAGAFTTVMVADRLLRSATGIEASSSFVSLGRKRIEDDRLHRTFGEVPKTEERRKEMLSQKSLFETEEKVA